MSVCELARILFLVVIVKVTHASDCDAADAPRAAFRRLIEATQADCSRQCSCHGLNGGLFSSVRARAFCLLHALAAGCALVATPGGEIRSYVNHAHCSDTSGWLCHLAPLSTCDAEPPEIRELGEVMEQFSASVPQLRWVANRTGLLSELAIFGELVAWVLRPSRLTKHRGAPRASELSDESTLAVHIRHGDRVKSRGARDASARSLRTRRALARAATHGRSRYDRRPASVRDLSLCARDAAPPRDRHRRHAVPARCLPVVGRARSDRREQAAPRERVAEMASGSG